MSVALSISLPDQQVQVSTTVLRNPLTVLDMTVQQEPPAAKGLQPDALSQVWWAFRFRHEGHARLGYASLPTPPLAGVGATTAPYNMDPAGAHDLSFESRFDAKGSRLLGGLSIAWIDDGSQPAPQVTVTPLEPAGSAINVPVRDIPGYRSAVTDVPLTTVVRWAFVSDQQLDALLPNQNQGVILLSAGAGRVVATARWDKTPGTVISLDVISPPEMPQGDLPDFTAIWWDGISYMADFPKKTENNEQSPLVPPMPHDAQEIVRTCDFKRELFLDGPGWLLSGAPALKSLIVDLLDNRGQDQQGATFPATVTVDGNPLTAGEGYGTRTNVSYSDIQQGTMSGIAVRVLWIPAHILAS